MKNAPPNAPSVRPPVVSYHDNDPEPRKGLLVPIKPRICPLQPVHFEQAGASLGSEK